MRLHPPIARAWRCALLVGVMLGIAIPVARAQTPAPSVGTAVDNPTAAIQKKLTGIIIPRLEFHGMPLAEVIEKMRQEGRRLDKDPNHAQRGINIFLKMPLDAPATPPLPINLTLRDISMQIGRAHV